MSHYVADPTPFERLLDLADEADEKRKLLDETFKLLHYLRSELGETPAGLSMSTLSRWQNFIGFPLTYNISETVEEAMAELGKRKEK